MNTRIHNRVTWAAAAALLTLILAGCRDFRSSSAPIAAAHRETGQEARRRPVPTPQPIRAVWVARFHYRYPDDVRTILRNAKDLGFNTVLWQVRGNATVAYRSRIEPWAEEFDFEDPGYDPLALATEEAHRLGLRIEAWANVMPGWKGVKPPPVADQIFHKHPEWFLWDAAGQRQPPGDFYQILNPCLPEVRRYIVSVMEEIVGNYSVDGLHMDYVRFAWDTTPNARQLYPRDPRTLQLFAEQTGKRPDDDPNAWDAWRANQLSRLVAEIREAIRGVCPGATLTAAVWSDPSRGYHEYFQNAVAWVRTHQVDALYPMAYTPDAAKFEGYVATYRQLAPGARVIPGIGAYMHKTPEALDAQLQHCLRLGGDFAVFSYESLFAAAGDRGLKPTALTTRNAEREPRRRVLASHVQP